MMLKRFKKEYVLLIFTAFFWSGFTFASPLQEYQFEPDVSYTVNTTLGVVTQIKLSPREVIKDFSTGLSNGWDLVRRDNVFYIKPKQNGVDTNLIVRTATHNYVFDLKVIGGNWNALDDVKQEGVNYVVRFRYPEGSKFNPEPIVKSTGYNLAYDPSKNYHTDYDVSASKRSAWLVPERVYDDGNFTYIYLKKEGNNFSGNFPTVYGRKKRDDQDFVVNSNVEKNIIIVHGTYPYLILRHENNVVGLRRN